MVHFSGKLTLRFNGSGVTGDAHYDPNAVAVTALAPNRGGRYSQNSHAVFYDQQVRFAEGPKVNDVVHVENGAWLFLDSSAQGRGPYDDLPAVPGPIVPQPANATIAKQIAVPHGNSVLALGHADGTQMGSPDIPDSDFPYPSPLRGADFPSWDISAFPYYTKLDTNKDYENPDPELALNPNRALQEAVKQIKPNAFIHWTVTTKPPGEQDGSIDHGVVTNIPFEQRRARVTCYTANYWLLSTDGGKKFDYLSYNQVIEMQIPLLGEPYNFPHVTANTVKR